MKILLAGITGIIGQTVLDQLLKKQHDVWVLLPDSTRLEEFQHMSVHAMVGDAAENGMWLGQLPENLDIVINLILPPISPHLSLKQVEDEGASHYFNVGKNLLYAAEKTQAKHFYQIAPTYCFTSGGSEISEKSPLNRESNTYGKLYMDLLPYIQSQKKVNATIIMHGIVYNSAGNTFPEIPKIAGRLPIISGGEQLVSLSHSEDIAASLLFLIEKDVSEQLITVVDDKPISYKEFLTLLGTKTQTATAPVPKFLAQPVLGEVITNTLTESGHARNTQLRSLGYWLKFPDIRAGFAAQTI